MYEHTTIKSSTHCILTFIMGIYNQWTKYVFTCGTLRNVYIISKVKTIDCIDVRLDRA